jgi:hypothetical protein
MDSPSALADDQTLVSCGVSKGDLLELLLVDMAWDDASLAIIERIENCDDEFEFTGQQDEGILALTWALVNAVWSM